MRRLQSIPTERLHLILMLALTFSTGAVDAVGYLGLDRVFTGNMTGNVVLLGMAFTGGTGLPILRPALALGCFMLGAALAGRVLRRSPEGWSHQTSSALLTVTLGLAALAVFVGLVSVQGNDAGESVTTSVMALMMGIQAATARRLKVTDVTTVVVTSTITGLASDSRLGGGNSVLWVRRALAIALILLGAVAGAGALHIHLWAGLALSALISAVVTFLGHKRYLEGSAAAHTEG